MVLLTGDPLADIHNAQKIDAVFVNGRLLTRRDLDALLAQAETAVKNKRRCGRPFGIVTESRATRE